MIRYLFIFNILFILFLLIGLNITFFNFCLANGAMDDTAAGEMFTQTEILRSKAGFGAPQTTGIGGIIAMIIRGFLALLGVIFIILILIAGYNWMIAAGDEEKVRKAKDTIQRAIIGLLIIVAAYAITYFVFKYMPWGEGGGGSYPP